MRVVHTLWNWVTTIHTTTPDQRRRGQLVAVIALGLIISAIGCMGLTLYLNTFHQVLPPLLVSIAVHIVVFVLARHGFVAFSAALMIVMAALGTFVSSLLLPEIAILPIFLIVPIMLASLTLSVRALFLIFLTALTMLLLLFWQADPHDLVRISVCGATLLLMGFAITTTGIHTLATSRLLHRMHHASAAVAAANTGLEVRVAERTAELGRALHDIAQLAYFDPLTNLANRRLFLDRLDQNLAELRASGLPFALLFLDLDRFKDVNDTLGHDVGDQLLCAVADRLRRCVAGDALLARLGGDEFALLLPGADCDHALAAAHQVQVCMEPSFTLGGSVNHVRASLGVACAPDHGDTPAALLQRADIAMYRAKQRGGEVQLYQPTFLPPLQERVQLEAELRRALSTDQLVLYYQPIVSQHTGEVVRAEALIRWHHPQRGTLEPERFIPLAEACGLSALLDRWVVRAALGQLAAWSNAGYQVGVTINLSLRSLQDHALPAYVETCLRATGAPAALATVEVTESAAMTDTDTALRVIDALRELGMRVALDDVGTGYAALTYLRQIPVDTMKVDRIFVEGIGREPRDEAVLRALAALGRNLGVTVVAEGVELPFQADWLRNAGYDELQGFLFGRPATADVTAAMFARVVA